MIMSIQKDGEKYLNTSEAATYLGVSRTTIDAMIKDGRLVRYIQGVRRANYFKQIDLDRLLELRQGGSETEDN